MSTSVVSLQNEHIAVYDRLAAADRDRDRAVAEHLTLLDTLNIAILGSQSSAVTPYPTPRDDTPVGSTPASAVRRGGIIYS